MFSFFMSGCGWNVRLSFPAGQTRYLATFFLVGFFWPLRFLNGTIVPTPFPCFDPLSPVSLLFPHFFLFLPFFCLLGLTGPLRDLTVNKQTPASDRWRSDGRVWLSFTDCLDDPQFRRLQSVFRVLSLWILSFFHGAFVELLWRQLASL